MLIALSTLFRYFFINVFLVNGNIPVQETWLEFFVDQFLQKIVLIKTSKFQQLIPLTFLPLGCTPRVMKLERNLFENDQDETLIVLLYRMA